MSCDHQFRNPVDFIGGAFIHDDGETLTLVDPLPPEIVETIHTSAHRIMITLQFVADDERLVDVNGNVQ